MSRFYRTFLQSARGAGLLALLLVGLTLPVAAQENWPLLAVNDAETANPDLVEVALGGGDDLDMAGRTVALPAGFEISVVSSGLARPRFMTFDGASNLLVTTAEDGTVLRFPYADGQLGERETLVSGLLRPSSVAMFTTEDGPYLYVGETSQVTRYAYDPAGPLGDPEVVIPDLPVDGSHWTRTVAFGPDGMLYLSVGSSCNICIEAQPVRAAISRANPDGSDFEIIATGLRNAVGLTFHPGTETLWATVNERDAQGNEIPPDLVTIVEDGANYGWPGCLPPDAAPQVPNADCSGISPPTIAIQPHSAPLGLVFWEGEGAPEAFSGDLIVAQHGSWNRQPPAAPKLLAIDFEDGVPVGARDFATGWQNEAGERWGRPAGIVQAPDGSLIVSDDSNGMIYRINPEE